jgi:hypothetical protein
MIDIVINCYARNAFLSDEKFKIINVAILYRGVSDPELIVSTEFKGDWYKVDN